MVQRSSTRTRLTAGACLGILGVVLGLSLHYSSYDRLLLLGLHRINRWPDQLWLFLTQLGDSALVLSVLLALAAQVSYRRAVALKTWLLGAFLSPVLKAWWDTPRPLAVVDASFLHVIGHPPSAHHAMPSGHSMAAAALAGVLWVYLGARPWWFKVGLMVLAVGIAVSRVAVGAHWPGDALVGLGVGTLLVVMAQLWEMRWPWERWLASLKADFGVLLLQGGLAFVLLTQPFEGWGTSLASALAVLLTAISLVHMGLGARGRSMGNDPEGDA